MNWTEIPTPLPADAVALRALADALKGELKTNLAAASTAEDLAEVERYRLARKDINAKLAAVETQEREDEAEAEEAEKAEAADKPAEPEAKDAEVVPADEVEVVEPEAAAKVSTTLSVATTQTVVKSTKPVGHATQWSATDDAPGKKEGEDFANFSELGHVLYDRAKLFTGGKGTKSYVAKAFARFDEAAKMSDNMMLNLEMFEDEIMAAMCAPLQPLYDLACANTSRRPVKNSLPTFQSPTRGGFSVYPSPSLTSITTGYGQWTSVDDANANATKSACQTITCATPVDYRIYGIYRCLTVKNLLQMTFPELVEAYLNRLAAAQARLGETLMLEAMGTGSTSIDAVTLGYNASTTITSTILNYLGLYAEIERWDTPTMDAWMPRWVLKAMQMDQVRRRRTDGGFKLVPSESEVTQQFVDAGVTPHFFMDRPSWATPIPNLATAGVLNFFPRHLEMLIAPRGKFAAMDRGDLNIGVAPNNLYRDNTSNTRNEFTLFFENFEGIINTTTCPAHIVQINNLCYNGVQVDDVIVGCEGIDEPGIGS